MATVCSNASSSSSSSISNSSSQKLGEPQEHQQELKETDLLDTHSKPSHACANSNTANSTKFNEFLFSQDDLLDKHPHPSTNGPSTAPPPLTLNASLHDYQALRIKVKSIENHLQPLVNQIATLVQFRDVCLGKNVASKSSSLASTAANTERNAMALLRVGEAVSIAVERFVSVGEAMAYGNPSIKLEMLDACRQATSAGGFLFLSQKISSWKINHFFVIVLFSALTIKTHTQIPNSVVNEIGIITNNDYGVFTSSSDKFSMIQAANNLLNSITKVLLLADIVLINQILRSKNKVIFSFFYQQLFHQWCGTLCLLLKLTDSIFSYEKCRV